MLEFEKICLCVFLWGCVLFVGRAQECTCDKNIDASNVGDVFSSSCTDVTVTGYFDLTDYSAKYKIDGGYSLTINGTLTGSGSKEFYIGDDDNDEANLTVLGNVSFTKDVYVYGKSVFTIGDEDDNIDLSFNIDNDLIINDYSVVEIWGSLTAKSVVVDEYATLIVHGDLTITNSGTKFNGKVIVTGDADIKKCTIGENGALVVVGNLDFDDSSMNDLASLNIYSIGGGSVTNDNGVTDYTGSTYDLDDITDEDLLNLLSNLGLVSTVSVDNGHFYTGTNWSNGAPVKAETLSGSTTIVAVSSMNFTVKHNLYADYIKVDGSYYYTYTLLHTGTNSSTLTFGSEENFTDNEDSNDFTFTIGTTSSSDGELKGNSGSTTTIWGNVYNYGTITVNGGGTIEIWGDVCNYGSITVNRAATLIIHGSYTGFDDCVLDVEDAALLIVYEDLNSNESQEVTIAGTLISGGNIFIGGDGNNKFSSYGIVSVGTISYDADTELEYSGSTIYGFTSGGNIEVNSLMDLKNNYYSLYAKMVDLGFVYEWTGGNLTSSWDDEANWKKNEAPSSSSVVMIPKDLSYYPEYSGAAEVYYLAIASGAKATVDAGTTVYIEEALEIEDNGTFTINNDLTENDEGISSIIVDGTVTGKATEVWSNMEGNLWWYFSNPMSDVSPADYANSYSTSYYVRLYNNSTFSYAGNTSSSTIYFDGVDAFGFAILNSKEDNTLTYSGTFNTKNYSHTAEYESENSYYQYVGNPYPSYIDYKTIYENSKSTLTATDASSCYIYTLSTESGSRGYATYNASSGEYAGSNARYISPGQCFWIQMKEGDKINITKDACTNSHDSEKPVSLKSVSASNESKTKIRLLLSNSNTNDEVLIIGDGNNGSDEITKYDSRKKMNSGVIGNIYTIKNDTGIVINSLPEFYDGDIIPLGYSVSSSGMTDFTISVSSLTNAGDYEIYLDDLQEGTSIQLTDTTEYTFTPSVASSDSRFQIRVASSESTEETETTTGIDDATTGDNISVYSSGQTAYVTVSEEWLQSSSRKIDVYNVAGQLVNAVELNDLETSFTLPDTGVYLIKVVSGSMIYTEKVLGE